MLGVQEYMDALGALERAEIDAAKRDSITSDLEELNKEGWGLA